MRAFCLRDIRIAATMPFAGFTASSPRPGDAAGMGPGIPPLPALDAGVGHAGGEVERLRTELEATRAELDRFRESDERNNRALCAIADGIAVVDMRGRITCLNPVASHLTGWSEDECLGCELSGVLNFADRQGRAVDVLADGFCSDPDAIVTLIRRDGHAILVDGAVAPVHGNDKRPLGTVVTFRNVTASTRLNRELAHQANHDALTGLQNRRAFRLHLQRAIRQAGEFGSGHALLCLDLDQFKAINDSGGHLAGDELLRQLALLLRQQLREHDSVARLGGDEFAVLLQGCTPAHAVEVAEKIRNGIVDYRFAWEGRDHRVGASIGVVAFADGRRSAEQLIAIADRLCYAAKGAGRNRVAVHDSAADGRRGGGRRAAGPGRRVPGEDPA
jgi:diguanylate cyclase (GGDEF)-like protein/PAS domain S-box-containing protein